MSFVSIIARENFLTVMSEGRVSCNGKPTGEEEFKKWTRVDKNFIVTFVGKNRNLTLELIQQAGLLTPTDGDFYSLADSVQKKLLTDPFKQFYIGIGLGGLNKAGQIEFFSMGTNLKKPLHFLPKGDEIKYTFFYLDDYGKPDLKKELIKYFRQTGFKTAAQVLLAQKLLNDSFAEINPSMNRKTFRAVITRG